MENWRPVLKGAGLTRAVLSLLITLNLMGCLVILSKCFYFFIQTRTIVYAALLHKLSQEKVIVQGSNSRVVYILLQYRQKTAPLKNFVF